MRDRPTLHDFIDEELLRAPMTLDLVLDAVLQRWRERLPGAGRGTADPARVLQLHRAEVTTAALKRLRESAQEDLQAVLPASPGVRSAGGRAAGAAPAGRPDPLGLLGEAALSLIEEDDVAVDIEIARCTETVKLKAETVLRELQTYTSALVNDPNVSRDTNPFRPERFVRALWAGVQVLPLPRTLHAAFLQAAAEPLARLLQSGYAAACRRLDEQGVVPASYRTIVVSGSSSWGNTAARYQVPDSLHSLRDSLPPAQRPALSGAPGEGPAAPAAPATPAAGPPPVPAATAGPDPQLIELLARLFQAIQTDFNLAPDTVALMQRLQPTALRVALRDPTLLDRYDHALWRFIDQLAHDIELAGPAQRLRLLGLGRNLVDHLSQAEVQDNHGFAWALERLLVAQRHGLAQLVAAAQPDIDRLQRIADAQASPSTDAMPLDFSTLDTVPAALLPPETTGSPTAAMGLGTAGLPPGAVWRSYLQGERRTLMSLWQDARHELALLREPATERLWAVRQQAIARLESEGLAHRYRVRSLVRRSAEKVMRGL